jgi:hypothetical protein
MDEAELEQCRAQLGVAPTVTLEELERVFMKRNFALIQGKSGAADEPKPELEAQRQALRAAYEKLSAHLREQPPAAARAEKADADGAADGHQAAIVASAHDAAHRASACAQDAAHAAGDRAAGSGGG